MKQNSALKVTFYPGCSLESTASDYNASIKAMAEVLHIELSEMEDWNCCGSTSAHSLNHDLSLSLSARNVVRAEASGRDLVIPCSLCFNRLKTAEKALREGAVKDSRFSGQIRIRYLLDFLSSAEVLDRFSELIKKPLEDLKAVCYMIGPWPRVPDVLLSPARCARPTWNLPGKDQPGPGQGVPHSGILFPELMGLAVGHPEVSKWFSRHFVDPIPLLEELRLL